MLRVLLQTFLGLIFVAAGCFLCYRFLQNLADGPELWNTMLAAPLLISGVLLLLRAGKSDASIVQKTQIPTVSGNVWGEKSGFEKKLEENNKISEEWNQVNETKDRLRMVEIAQDSEIKSKS